VSGIPFRVTPASTPLGATGNLALTGYQALMVAYSDTNGTSCAAARRAAGFAPVPACSLPEDVKG
jgi:hypothetical protein